MNVMSERNLAPKMSLLNVTLSVLKMSVLNDFFFFECRLGGGGNECK